MNGILLFVVAMAMVESTAMAHESLQHFVQLRITSTLRAEYLDSTLEITLHGKLAARERLRMDGDRDGRITNAEKAGYLASMEAGLDQSITWVLGAGKAAATPLYEPAAEFEVDQSTGEHDVTLRFFTFAPVPGEPSHLSLTCMLFPDAPVLAEWEVARKVEGENQFLARQKAILAAASDASLSRTISMQLPRRP